MQHPRQRDFVPIVRMPTISYAKITLNARLHKKRADKLEKPARVFAFSHHLYSGFKKRSVMPCNWFRAFHGKQHK